MQRIWGAYAALPLPPLLLLLQVRVDVERSLHSFAGFLTDPERAARRRELTRLLNAVVIKHEGEQPQQ
jgi:hypothetical protein